MTNQNLYAKNHIIQWDTIKETVFTGIGKYNSMQKGFRRAVPDTQPGASK